MNQIPWDFDIFDESWRLKDTIYKTSIEAQAAIDRMEAELRAMPWEQRVYDNTGFVIRHTKIVRDLLKEIENDNVNEDVAP